MLSPYSKPYNYGEYEYEQQPYVQNYNYPFYNQEQQYQNNQMKKYSFWNIYGKTAEKKLDQQQQFEPHSPTRSVQDSLKQSPVRNINYFDMIQHVIEDYEENHSLVQIQNSERGAPYSLYEDLKLLSALHKERSVTNGTYKQLAERGYINRSHESIKTRYTDFLINIQPQDIQVILTYIENSGMDAYLVFEKGQDGLKHFKGISESSPKLSGYTPSKLVVDVSEYQQDQQKQNPQLNEQIQRPYARPVYQSNPYQDSWRQFPYDFYGGMHNPYIYSNYMYQPPMPPPHIFYRQRDPYYKNADEPNIIVTSPTTPPPQYYQGIRQLDQPKKVILNQKRKYSQLNDSLDEASVISYDKKSQMSKKTPNKKNNQQKNSNKKEQSFKNPIELLSKKDQLEAEDLDVVLTVVANWINQPKKYLITCLDQLSGDLNLLDKFLTNNDEHMLWNEEDDDILQLIKNNKEPAYQLLLKIKGEENIKRRQKYLENKFSSEN